MIKLSGKDVTFGENTVSQSGQRLITKTGIRGSVLTGKRTTGFHWNGHRFPPPLPGSVLYYPGYPAQGSVIQDFSGQGNHGTITGATWKQNGQGLWGSNLNGTSDQISCGKPASLQFTDRFTFECWLRVESVNAGNHRGVAGKTTTIGSNGWGISYFDTGGGSLRLYILGDFTGWEAISQNIFYHVVGTFDKDLGSNQIKLYISGSVKQQGTRTTTITDVDTDFLIGRHTPSASYYFDGDIFLTRAYNVALSAEVVASHYAQERHLFNV